MTFLDESAKLRRALRQVLREICKVGMAATDDLDSLNAAGKPCPLCREPMSNLTSQYRRVCTNGKCGHVENWPLNPGQKPLFGSNRA